MNKSLLVESSQAKGPTCIPDVLREPTIRFTIELFKTNETSGSKVHSKTDNQFTVYVPNAFTPQDGVINDYFAPIIYGKELIQTYKFQVISRWGDILFSSESPYEVWYANVSGGDYFSKNDVFLWELVITRKDSPRKYSLQGHVMVIR